MSMQLRVVHTTEFEYDGLAAASYNQARMTPVTGPGQIVVHTRLDVHPKPWTSEYRDYFGSQVIAFEVLDPHEAMSVVATSTVQVDRGPAAPPTTPWEEYQLRAIADRWTDYLTLPDLIEPAPDFAKRAQEAAAAAGTPGGAAQAVCQVVHEEIEFLPGSTDVRTTAAESWKQRAGVCQDMVHLAIGGLRSIGIPARYVSGYVHPVADPVVGETVAGDSRAWLEWWDAGWQAYDPSANAVPDDRYVAIATGRDYHDVSPLSGIYSGAKTSRMTVDVSITRTA